MRRTLAVGAVLWVGVLLLWGGIAAVSLADDAPAESAAIAGGTGNVTSDARSSTTVSIAKTAVTANVTLPGFEVAVGVTASGDARVSMQSNAIDDDTARAANAGLCAVGLHEANSPVQMNVTEGSARVDATTEPAVNDNDDIDPQSVVERCRAGMNASG